MGASGYGASGHRRTEARPDRRPDPHRQSGRFDGPPPTGPLTFLFSDIEGSTRLWEKYADAMPGALARHDRLLREATVSNGGHVVKSTGDGILAVFARANDAIAAAVAGQQAIASEPWNLADGLRVRMALHTGEVTQRDGDYFGAALHRASRLLGCAHGGQVLCSSATAALALDALPEGVEFADLGDHALRDLVRPERVYQVNADGLPDSFPPILSTTSQAGNLPAPTTSFIGRRAALEAIDDLLQPSRLVCITGVGGVGKTRLALEVASVARARFAHGAWFCDLSAVTEPENVIDVVIATLGVKPSPGRDGGAVVADYLRHKKLLLVLDNCEHVLEPIARLGEQVLRACSGVSIVATSRESLGVPGEQIWPLKPLTAGVNGTDGPQSDAVQLFVDRARDARPDFALAAANEEAVVEVCRRLDGIPLAIELAAARVAIMSPKEISSRLDERFRLLTGTRRRVERHQTLRAAIEWSYSLLSVSERAIFSRLGVFSGSFDAEAAAAVAFDESLDPWQVLEGLQGLTAKSMVVAEVRDEGPTTYSMLETLRRYAREVLDAEDDADQWRRRHAEYFAVVAEREGPRHLGPDEIACQQRIVSHLDNLRAAAFWSLDRPDEHRYALRIVAALCGEATANKGTGVGAWAEQAVDFVEETTPGKGAAILGAAAWRSIDRADFGRARELAARAYEHCFDPDCPYPALASSALALLNSSESVDAAVEVISYTARTLEQRAGEEVSVAMNYSGLASFSVLDPTELPKALTYAERSRELALASGSLMAQAVAASTLGQVYLVGGDAERALGYLEESIELTQNGASDVMYAIALRCASRAATQLSQWPRSARYTHAMVDYAQHTGDERSLYDAFSETIVLFVRTDRLADAVALDAHTKAVGLDRVTFGGLNQARERAMAKAIAALPADERMAAERRGAALPLAAALDMVVAELDALAGVG